MANEIYTFKKQAQELIDRDNQKVWLAKKQGKRVEYMFKIGAEQFSPAEKIVESKRYILFCQKIGKEKREQLKKLFEEYIDIQV